MVYLAFLFSFLAGAALMTKPSLGLIFLGMGATFAYRHYRGVEIRKIKKNKMVLAYVKPLRKGNILQNPNGSWYFSVFDKTNREIEITKSQYPTDLMAEAAQAHFLEERSSSETQTVLSLRDRKDKLRPSGRRRFGA